MNFWISEVEFARDVARQRVQSRSFSRASLDTKSRSENACYTKRMTLLRKLSNNALRSHLRRQLADGWKSTAELIETLMEVDRRKLWAEDGYSSLYRYCVDLHRMSEGQAYRRIAAARVAHDFPKVLDMIARGDLHLAGIAVLRKHLTKENGPEVLRRATGKTCAELRILVAELAPKPDVSSSLTRVPEPKPAEGPGLFDASPTKNAPEAPTVSRPAARRVPTTKVAPRSVGANSEVRYKLETMISESTRAKLAKAQALCAHAIPSGDTDALLDRALDALIEQETKRKHAKVDKPRRPSARRKHEKTIPANVKRAVHERDEGRCSYHSPTGKRCDETSALEYDHVKPLAHGGKSTVDNVRLLCRAHNQLEADRKLGRTYMDAKRHRISKVSEFITRYERTQPPRSDRATVLENTASLIHPPPEADAA